MLLMKLQIKGNSEALGFLATFQNVRKTFDKKYLNGLPLDLTKITPMWKAIETKIF